MTVIVSVKINNGVVMAADSVTTFGPFDGPAGEKIVQHYPHANKIVNLRKDLPIGAMVTGAGSIDLESIDTLLKDLRRRFRGDDPAHSDWKLDPDTYTVKVVAERLRQFLFEEKSAAAKYKPSMLLRVCGYSAGRPLPETWQVHMHQEECLAPELVQAETFYGAQWNGETEALNRLVLGLSGRFGDVATKISSATKEDVEKHLPALFRELRAELVYPAMPIQDAIDLARFLVETTAGFVKYSLQSYKTVGGPVEIAAITKHEGFRWVQRKHFYRAELNPPVS